MTDAQAETQAAPAAERTLRLRRTFAAPREKVFRAWTDPEELVKWWGPGGFTVPICELDVRPGGAFRTCMRSPDGDEYNLSGVYREVTPPERLVFTWVWREGALAGQETLVTVEFHDRDGATEVVLTHEGFPDAAVRGMHEQGWSSSLDCLEEVFRGGP